MTLPIPMATTGAETAKDRLMGRAFKDARARQLGRKHIGLSVWFRVTVEGGGLRQSLGEWSKCSGLGISIKSQDHRPGGRYDRIVRLPEEAGFSQIVLERAVERESSFAVREWIQSVVDNWINADDGGVSYEPSTVRIELYGAYKGEVIDQWVLRNAVPAAWSGPTMTTESGGIAKESLTIVHDGFLNEKQESQAKLRLEKLKALDSDAVDGEPIVFDYNPAKISRDKGNTLKSSDGGKKENRKAEQAGGSTGSEKNVTFYANPDHQIVDPGSLSLKVSDLLIDGVKKVKEQVDKLFTWLDTTQNGKPLHTRLTLGAEGGKAGSPASGGLTFRVILKSVNVNYNRFTASGDACRAQVSLIFEGATKEKPKINPTSETKRIGRSHTVTAGDSLASMARDWYGSPSAWRTVADDNGIDDPMRVRNGSSLILNEAT